MTILDEILEHKVVELAEARARLGDVELARQAESCTEPLRGFRAALCDAEPPCVIAEIKHRSPSMGEIRPNFDPASCAKEYSDAGAAALSVLTDSKYFGGHLSHLEITRKTVDLPLLRKDFVIDRYQIDEARVHGADAVLLIVAAFAGDNAAVTLSQLHQRAVELGLDALVEIHDEAELDTALSCGADLIGINARDLRTFEVDLGHSERLARLVPDRVLLVAASGISANRDIARLQSAGAGAFLVGESLMREADIGKALRRLRRSTTS